VSGHTNRRNDQLCYVSCRMSEFKNKPPRATQTSRVVTIAAAHAAHDTYGAFLPPLLPVFIEKLSLAKAEAGLLTVFLQGPSLLQPLIGHLGDRFDLRVAVILTPALTAACMSLLGIAPGYAVIALLLVTSGVSAAVLHSLAPVMAGRLSGHRLGYGMGFWMVGGELGRTLGPIVLVSAIAILGLEGMPWLMVGGVGASVLLYLGVCGISPVRGVQVEAGTFSRALRSMRGLLFPLSGVVVFRSFMMAAFATYLPVFLRDEGASLWFAGASLSVLEAGGVIGALVGGSASDVLGRRRVLVASFLLTPLLMFVLVLTPGWWRLPLLLPLGFIGLMATPVIMASVQESATENRALANGIYMALNFVLRALIVVVVGALADRLSMRPAFLACAVLGLLGTPFVFRLPGRNVRDAVPD
jgi:FSR family fosmidomycin resistance protein-like MFS transporter